ncbi:MAG: PrsW family glutamic-type intramembrane protease [Planctomycetales bacterium]
MFAGFIFCAIFAAPAMNGFFSLASELATQQIAWQEAPLMAFQQLGRLHTLIGQIPHPSQSPLEKVLEVISYMVCVGATEEFLKLLPVIAFIKLRYMRTLSDVYRVAAFSAFGFGVSEAWWYCWYQMEFERSPLTQYIGRLLSCPLAHVAFSLLASHVLVRLAARVSGTKYKLKNIFMTACIAAFLIGGLHGLYDWLLFRKLPGLAGVLMTAVAFSVIHLELLPGARCRSDWAPSEAV